MTHQYDHRHATYEGQDAEQIRKGQCRELSDKEKGDPLTVAVPRFWINDRSPLSGSGASTDRKFYVGFRDITRAVDKRTAQFAVLPRAAVGNQLPLLLSGVSDAPVLCCLLANLNSFSFDFATRQKVGGTHMNFFIVKQLPVFPPQTYTKKCWSGRPLVAKLARSVLELVYTASDLKAFAQACGYEGPPFKWNEERRAQLRAKLDAIYFHLYGISRDDVAYILDTFPIVRRKDEAKYGEYRTKRMTLEKYDEYEGMVDG